MFFSFLSTPFSLLSLRNKVQLLINRDPVAELSLCCISVPSTATCLSWAAVSFALGALALPHPPHGSYRGLMHCSGGCERCVSCHYFFPLSKMVILLIRNILPYRRYRTTIFTTIHNEFHTFGEGTACFSSSFFLSILIFFPHVSVGALTQITARYSDNSPGTRPRRGAFLVVKALP